MQQNWRAVDLVLLITYLYQHFPVFFNVFVRHFLFLFLLSLYRFVNIRAKFFAKNKKKILRKKSAMYSFLWSGANQPQQSDTHRTQSDTHRTQSDTHTRHQWRLVVKMAGRATKFHLWLNIQDCRPECPWLYIMAFPVTPAVLNLSNW